MKVPANYKKQIIDGLLQMLGPAVEEGTVLTEVTGATALANGIKKDTKGHPIVAGLKYLVPAEGMVDVDHSLKLTAIIEEAKDVDDMNEKLAEYLSKYAKSKEVVNNYIKTQQ